LPLAFNNVAIKLFNCYSENVDIFNQIWSFTVANMQLQSSLKKFQSFKSPLFT
jgi:uncharacterized membrane protein YoaT (DUF817 family)